MSLNKAQLIGRLGRDPEIKISKQGDKIATLSIATSEKWKDSNGEQRETTEWHKVVFFKKIAEFCEKYIKKGDIVYAEGKITTQKYIDKQGIEKYSTNINGIALQIIGGKKDKQEDEHNQYLKQSGSLHNTQNRNQPQESYSSNFDDDIPF